MGAIFGIVGEGIIDEVSAMGNRMFHRGDQQKCWSPYNNVYLGKRFWSYEDSNSDNNIIGDLQLQNKAEIIDKLNDSYNIDLQSSDIRLIEYLYNQYGMEIFQYIKGFFSIAIWDKRKASLILVIDHIGYKSIYYAILKNRIAFASEYKALLALEDIEAEPNLESIQYYLATRNFLKGKTFLKNVNPVNPGEIVIASLENIANRRYWYPEAFIKKPIQKDHERYIRQTLETVVKAKANDYQKIGVAVGNGLDSSSVLAVLRHQKPDVEILTFTVGYGEDDPEVIGGSKVSRIFKAKHNKIIYYPESIPKDLSKLIWLMEDCSGREEALLIFKIINEAAKYVDILMFGHGPDTLFGGMPRHLIIRWAQLLPMLKTPLSEFYTLTQSGNIPKSLFGKIMQLMAYKGKNFDPPSVLGVNNPTKVECPKSLNNAIIKGLFNNHSLGYIEPKMETHRLKALIPVYDPYFIEASLKIPEKIKIGLLQQKKILRNSMKDLLPPSVRNRKKAIQRIKHNLELSEIIDAMSEELLTPSQVRDRGMIEPNYTEAVRRRPLGKAYPTDQLYRLWTLISIEIWARQFLDRRGEPWGFGKNELFV